MGRFNELLAARFNEGLSAVLGLSEQEGARTVAPEIMPVFMSEMEKPEHAFLKQERLAIGFGQQAADVANLSVVALLNPLGSNLVICLETVWFDSALATTWAIGVATIPALIGQTNKINTVRDTRWTGIAGRIVGGTFATQLGTIQVRVPASESLPFELEYVITPGFAFVVSGAAINTPVSTTWKWRERAMLPEETGV